VRIEFRPIRLAPLGVRRVAEVGTAYSPIPRSDLLKEFLGADILLFHSLSQGNAAVILEAVALQAL
jgi:hypothetical protein